MYRSSQILNINAQAVLIIVCASAALAAGNSTIQGHSSVLVATAHSKTGEDCALCCKMASEAVQYWKSYYWENRGQSEPLVAAHQGE